MAFKRQNFKSLRSTKRENFESKYKFSKQVSNFKAGSDVYVLPLGLESGFYETPCHRVAPHKVGGQTIGFGGSGVTFSVYVKCNGIDEDGTETPSLCCALAQRERERIPDSNDAGKRIISSRSSRIHLPILVLGNSIGDDSKLSYPISKVSILKDLKSEAGLKFSYLDMSSYTFKTEIMGAYGKKLKEEGELDYELDEESEEFCEEVCKRLQNTVIKIHGITKTGFTAAMKEYSFFPFSSPAVASGSGEAERKAIIGYRDNTEIMGKVDEFLQLFNVEVDKLIRSWNEKDLQEYYNSAIGLGNIKDGAAETEAPAETEEVTETVEVIEEAKPEKPAKKSEPVSDEEMDKILADPFAANEETEEVDEIEYGLDEDESFFDEE